MRRSRWRPSSLLLIGIFNVGATSITCQNVSIPPDSGNTVVKGCNGGPRPTYQFPFLRFDEDWSFLRCAQRTDYWDRIKYIPLGHEGAYLSFGGDVREVYESYDEQYWGDGPQDRGGWLVHHYLAHGDLHLRKSSRLFAELQAAFEDGRRGGPRPYDEDKLNLHQAFLDLGSLESPRHLTLRLGRQELYYGSGRLVDARFGLNTRISFDGAKVIAQAGNTHIEAFATRPTLQKQGIFDDVPDSKKAFWGIYSATATRLDRSVEFYYFGYLAAQQTFSVCTAYFQSHTVGGRWAGKKASVDFDEEANVQLGKFGKGDIRAWSAAFSNGYSLESTKGRPRISLRSDVTSGDNDLDDRHLGTFYPLYARGKYFGEADLNGPVNTIDLIPQLDIHLSRRLTTDLSYGAFWRESLQDGVYGFVGNLYKPGSSTRARFIGQQAEVDLNFVLAPHILLRCVYQHFFAGNFLKEVPPGHDVNYATAWFDYHF